MLNLFYRSPIYRSDFCLRRKITNKYTHYVPRIAVLDLQKVHRPDHRLHSHENVLIHEFDEPSLVFVRITGAVDDPHLFNEGGLARFAGTCNKVLISVTLLLE